MPGEDFVKLADLNSGQGSMFTRPVTPAVVDHSLCHNCGEPMGEHFKCLNCGASQRTAEKRERQPRETITLLLADAGNPNDPPMNARLKRAVKALGRAYKLRVVEMK